jgi:formate hydrogenlyase subunit 3/multisubunit Na+/H+ antiporter MnhD subunit
VTQVAVLSIGFIFSTAAELWAIVPEINLSIYYTRLNWLSLLILGLLLLLVLFFCVKVSQAHVGALKSDIC